MTSQLPESILGDSEILAEATAPEAGSVPLETARLAIDKPVAIQLVEIDVALE